MSATGNSTVSATDVNVFKRLANPAVVDVHVDSRFRRATVEMKKAIEQAAVQSELGLNFQLPVHQLLIEL